MTNAMKTMLRELMGYRTGNVRHHPKAFSLIVSKADMAAAQKLSEIGVVKVIERRAYPATQPGDGA